MQILYGMIFLLVLGGIYVLFYYFNQKTPKPEGCENLEASCQGCTITSCGKNPLNEYKEKENNA